MDRGIFGGDPAGYLLIAAIVIQSWYLSKPGAHRFWGNLIGVTIYTLVDLSADGMAFFQDYVHLIFWCFSLTIAALQGFRFHITKNWEKLGDSFGKFSAKYDGSCFLSGD
jgi:hypothetical protein